MLTDHTISKKNKSQDLKTLFSLKIRVFFLNLRPKIYALWKNSLFFHQKSKTYNSSDNK